MELIHLRKILIVAAIVAAGLVGFFVSEARRDSAAPQSSKRSVSAREAAKDAARKAIRRHGKRASQAQREAAADVITAHMPKKSETNGTSLASLFADAHERTRLERVGLGELDPSEDDAAFTDEERAILKAANESISDHDFAKAQEVARAALASKDPRVRTRAVETLSDFGEKGLVELSDFLVDSDRDVAQLAQDRFELGLQEMESESERTAAVKLGILTVDDPERLESLMGTLLMTADEPLLISALVDIIEGGTPNQSAAAMQTYEDQTGQQWTSAEDAEAWLESRADGN